MEANRTSTGLGILAGLACGAVAVVVAAVHVYRNGFSWPARRGTRVLTVRYTNGLSVLSSSITVDETARSLADLEATVRQQAPAGMISKTDSLAFHDRRPDWTGHVAFRQLRTVDDIICVGQLPDALDVVIDD